METTGAKPNNRGGARTPVRLKQPGARMLHCLITSFGGPTKFGRLIGETLQTVIVWRRRGAVPFKKVGEVSRALKLPPYLFNYLEVQRFTGSVPSWEAVVKKAPLSNDMKKWVLAAGGYEND